MAGIFVMLLYDLVKALRSRERERRNDFEHYENDVQVVSVLESGYCVVLRFE